MIMKSMKAIQVSAPGGEFELVQRAIPEPTEGQVRVKVLACGVCHGDVTVKNGGHYPGLEYPRIPGHEIVGVIEKMGAGVGTCKLGQRVGVGWPAGITYDGGFAEYMVTSAKEIVLVPGELNEMEAAPLLCAGVTTLEALKNSGAKPGDIVAVQGIGGLGHLAIQYARKMGFKTIAISRGADKKEFAEKLGAHVFIDTESEDAAKELQNMGGAKAILTTAPNSKAIADLINSLGMDGKLMIISGGEEPIQVSPGKLIAGKRSIQGWRPPVGADAGSARKDTMDFSLLTGVHTMIEAFPLEQIDRAYEKMLSSKIRFRAVLTLE
jgi:propanol-preferring alcohol dehydrogenase